MSQEQTKSREQQVTITPKKKRGRKPASKGEFKSNGGNQPSTTDKYVERYYRVRFHEKAVDHDTDNVPLCLNGEVLNIQRGVEIILPGRFKEVADQTVYPKFSLNPGEDLKVKAKIKTYGYDVLGEATADEYFEKKAVGDLKTREYYDDISGDAVRL